MTPLRVGASERLRGPARINRLFISVNQLLLDTTSTPPPPPPPGGCTTAEGSAVVSKHQSEQTDRGIRSSQERPEVVFSPVCVAPQGGQLRGSSLREPRGVPRVRAGPRAAQAHRGGGRHHAQRLRRRR